MTQQTHKANTVKQNRVYEGDPLVIMGDPLTNADLTQEYFFGEKMGMGLVVANNTGIGRYEIAQSTGDLGA